MIFSPNKLLFFSYLFLPKKSKTKLKKIFRPHFFGMLAETRVLFLGLTVRMLDDFDWVRWRQLVVVFEYRTLFGNVCSEL